MTRDRLKLARVPMGGARSHREELEALDAYYRSWGFKPIAHGEKITPKWMRSPYDLGENLPTFRQFCGGFALAPLLGGRYCVPTPDVFRVVEGIGTRTDAPEAWDVVVFHAGSKDGRPQDVGHFALIESVGAASVTPGLRDSSHGKVILTKNQEERAYRGALSDFVDTTRVLDVMGLGGEKAPASRPGKWDFTFYRIPWHESTATRLGGPHADDRPLLKGTSTCLRVQVVDAESYELLPGAEVKLRYPMAAEFLKTVAATTGVHDFSEVPGSSGTYEIMGSATGYANAFLTAKLNAGTPVNVIVALKREKVPEDAALVELRRLHGDLEDVAVEMEAVSMDEQGRARTQVDWDKYREVNSRLTRQLALIQSFVEAHPGLKAVSQKLLAETDLRAQARAKAVREGKPDPGRPK